ncbi:4-hydroxy-tetrahydrodipicolinate synthase [Palleronia marisminoris]|uniref:4-hydroxy-tetrahydrodipicolinate synthase n=1 Tax=Palleronia marisminoris TaxID=315423 RepID=A0A1Y5RWW0_9RHOB|nr:dihydrodipicolinate synthase family protein [Palleronia marisminoris]SFG42838.1 4-hydroxy-tetrahydrodipicolinate synthase [Palleronia marisminoris]SLN27484.1 4-hydroxy-tetrahydrodipicolinate synthase [Palleronia marisminoris]
MLKGLSAFPITPITDGALDDAIFARMIERIVAAGCDSVGALGSTGAGPYLPAKARRRAVAVAAETTAGRIPLWVGIGALTTEAVCAHTREAEAAGADGLLLQPVSYQRLTDDEVFHLFTDAAAATALPLCIYDNPATTGFRFSDDLILRIAALPTVVAAKRPLPEGDVAADLAPLRAASDLSLGYSQDWGMLDALAGGGDVFFSVLAGTRPEAVVPAARAAIGGDLDLARQLAEPLEPIWSLFRRFGGYRVVHAIASRDYGTPLPPLRPVLPLPDAALPELDAALDHL